jgi:hypothetical protein
VRIEKAKRCRRAHFLVIKGRKGKSVHQKEAKGTHKLKSIKGEHQDREREKARDTYFLESAKGEICQYVENKKASE